MAMINRVAYGIARMKAQIENRILEGLTTKEAVAEASVALNINFEEYCVFQNLKSEACASGKLTTDEGMTIYACLGSGPASFNKQTVEVKTILTKLLSELLKSKCVA